MQVAAIHASTIPPPPQESLAEAAARTAFVAKKTSREVAGAARAMHAAADELARLALSGGGVGRVHIAAPDTAHLTGLRAYLSAASGARAVGWCEGLQADVGLGPGSLPYEDNSFDVAYTLGMALCLWPSLLPALQELRRVVRPTGMLVLCDTALA